MSRSGILGRKVNTAWCSCLAGLFLMTATAAAAPYPGLRGTMTVQLKWRHSFQFAGYYAAIEKGFYRDEGLRVALIEGRPGINFIEQVVSGQADYGVESPALLLARSRGKPVVVLAAVFQHSPLVLLTRKDSGLLTPHDFIHKTIMAEPDSDAEILAMFVREGLSLANLHVKANSWNLDDLISGKVDGVSAYITDEPFVMRQRNVDPYVVNPDSYGIDFYGDCLFTSEQEIKKHPVRVEAFRRASLRGWDYAMAHPEEIIALIRDKYSPDAPDALLRFEADEMRKLIQPDFIEIGHMNPGRWRHIAETYASVGMLSSGEVPDGFLYSPETGMLPKWVRWAVVVLSGSVLLVVLAAVSLYLFNRRLARRVNLRTAELTETNALLIREIAERKRAEREIRESEENLSTTLNSIGDAVISTDTQGLVMRMNPVAERLTGRDEHFAHGRPLSEVFCIINADTRQQVQNPVEQVLVSGEVIGLENHSLLVSRDGTEYQIADCAAPIRNSAGTVTGVVLVFRDVTDLYEQEERIRRSETKYRTFFENSRDAMLIIENGEFVDCNAAAVEMLGYSDRADMIHVRPEALSPEYQPDGQLSEEKSRKMMKAALTQGENRFEWTHLRKDGSVIPVEVSLTATEGGSKTRLQTVWRDLTGHKRAERERERLIRAIEQVAEIIVITDACSAIQYVNPAFEQITGYSREEVLGENPRILKSGKLSPAFYQAMWRALTAGKTWTGRFINRKKDGSLYTEEATISPVYDAQGKITNYIAAKCDITRQIQLEDQLRQAQKMEVVGQMAGGIAHDFNNLLQIIYGFAELAQMSGVEGGPIELSIREIMNTAKRGKAVVGQLLAFSRQQVIQMTDINLNSVVSAMLGMLRGMICEDVELSFVPGAALNPVHADRGLLEQVIMNLCANARDAMSAGGKLTIETENIQSNETYVETHTWASPGKYVLLRVTDTGIGMDQKTLDRIFEPFYTTKEVGKGTGLGLAVVYGIVEQHQGHTEACSEPGKGTVFTIYLPAVERSVAEAVETQKTPVTGGKETLLVAEDNESVLRLAEMTLRSAGYTVISAANGEEAVRMFQEHADEIDMAIMDVVMPLMGGRDALEKIHELRPNLPYLFASGYSTDAMHTGFIQNGKINLISKPYDAEELLCRIRAILDAGSVKQTGKKTTTVKK